MLCPVCQHPNREGLRFCTQCGSQLLKQRLRKGRLIVISEPASSSLHRRRGLSPLPGQERRAGIDITLQPLLLGRDADNTLSLEDDQASAHHAKVTSDGQQFWIEDLGSTNGTYVDGVRIHDRTLLHSECLIKIGTTIVKFESRPIEEQEMENRK